MISRALSRRFASQKALLESSVSVQDRILSLKWSDGTSGRFPLIWLRDCSPDEKTYTRSPAMTARNLTMRAFDVETSPNSISVDAASQELVIDWPGDVHSRYPSDWLRLRNPTDDAARARRRKVYLFPESTWGKSEIESRLKRFDHDKVLNDDKTLHDFLEAVCLDGIAVVKGGPEGGRTAVQDIGRRVGLIQRTHFGEVFEVSTKADASNMAYASDGELPFHTDFPSLANPPQLQMLHMFSRAAEGGNSIFVDGFHVAEQMRREHPDLFRLLTTYSAEYIEEGYDVHDSVTGEPQTYSFDMCARHKVIRLDDSGRVEKIQFGNAMRSWFYDCEPEKVQEIYRAMKVFTDMCYQPENVLKFQLENGDTVLWANTRLLHTRDAFRNAPGKARTLYGCYFAWDMIKSRVRVIRDQLGLEQNQPSA